MWILDLVRSVRSRSTFGADFDALPRWAPSGNEFAFASLRNDLVGLYVQPADSSVEPKNVTTSQRAENPQAWSADGRILLFLRGAPQTGMDLWTVRRKADGSFEEPSVWLQSAFDEYNASFSPDGRTALYTSNESGHPEVYVQAFPGGGGKRQISSGGGDYGRWSRDGKEIFYVRGNSLVAAPGGAGEGHELFRLPMLEAINIRYPYDVSPDGKRFLVAYPADAESAKPPAIHVVQNWPALLRGNGK